MKDSPQSGPHGNLGAGSPSMPYSEIEQSILAFVAKETGHNPKRLALNSRLVHDLGVDGDDAVELFEKFGEKYGVDLTALFQNWDQYFVPEGHRLGMGCMIAVGVAAILGDLLHRAYPPIPAWAWMIALPIACLFVHAKFFAESADCVPITIQELVDAAISRTWDRHYEPQGTMFRSGL